MAKFSFVLLAYVSGVLNTSMCFSPIFSHCSGVLQSNVLPLSNAPVYQGSALLYESISSSICQNADSDSEVKAGPRLWELLVVYGLTVHVE